MCERLDSLLVLMNQQFHQYRRFQGKFTLPAIVNSCLFTNLISFSTNATNALKSVQSLEAKLEVMKMVGNWRKYVGGIAPRP